MRHERNIAPNISEVVGDDGVIVGYRVYGRELDPRTGRYGKVARRFGPERTLEELVAYREAPGDLSDGFSADARRYLALEAVQHMPSIKTRRREIKVWMGIFGDMPRSAIDTNMINDALHRMTQFAPSNRNKHRTALMSLWTTLDGRSAANPVRDSVVFAEAELVPRGQSYELLTRILDAIPDEPSLASTLDRATLYRELWAEPASTVARRYGLSGSFLGRLCTRWAIPRPGRGYWTVPPERRPPAPLLPRRGRGGPPAPAFKSRARLEVLAFTGMDPSQLSRMTPADFGFEGEGWYLPPARRKGVKVRRTPRLPVRLPMTPASRAAFERLVAVDGLGAFQTASLGHTWTRACRRAERQIREELGDAMFRIPHIRLKDLRHSFGTKVYADTGGDQNAVGRMLTHAPGSPMTLRYALGAVPDVLRQAMAKVTSPARRAPYPRYPKRPVLVENIKDFKRESAS